MTNEEILAQPNHLERRALMAWNILQQRSPLGRRVRLTVASFLSGHRACSCGGHTTWAL